MTSSKNSMKSLMRNGVLAALALTLAPVAPGSPLLAPGTQTMAQAHRAVKPPRRPAARASSAPQRETGSLLDRLPRVAPGGYAAALAKAQARGPAGHAD